DVGVEDLRGSAGDGADLGAAVHVEVYLALEVQRALDHRVRADDHARFARGLEREVEVRLLDFDPADHVRADAHRDVAVDRLDALAEAGADQADAAVDRLHAAADLAAAIHEHAAVHGFD